MRMSDLSHNTSGHEVNSYNSENDEVNFSSTATLPKILYKYRDWNNPYHQRILRDNKLYFASPRTFEDELDCKGLESFPPKEKLFDFFHELSNQKGMEMTELQKFRFATYWSQNSLLANPQELRKKIEYYDNQFYDLYGVCSLTEVPYNRSMWKKYSDNYKGICIGFDGSKLNDIAGEEGPVIYTIHKPLIKFMQDSDMTEHFKRVYFKEQKWSFEHEYRLAKMWKDKPQEEERNISMLSGTIVEIILGCNISAQNKSEITQLVRQKYSGVEIKQMETPLQG